MNFKKAVITAVVIAVAAIAAIAAILWLIAAKPSEIKTEVVRVSGTEAPDFQFLFSVIKDRGIDKKNGLDLEFVWSPPGEVERKLADRDAGVEVGPFNPISLAETNLNRGTELRSFAPILYNYFYFVVRSDSPFYTLDDLRGARIATRPKLSAAYKTLAMALKLADMDLENDFKLTFGSIPESIQALVTREVDATLLPQTATVNFLSTGQYRQIIDLEKTWEEIAGSPMPFVSLTAHENWIDKNPDKVKKLRQTVLDAAVFINANPEIIGEYKDLLDIKTDEALKMMEEDLPRVYPVSWNADIHHFILEKAIEFGIINGLPHEEMFIR